MRSRRTKPRSIATELVLLFTLAGAVLLGCALGGFYWLVVRHATAEDNAVLAERIRAVRSELREPDGARTLSQELNTRRAAEPNVYWIRIIDERSGTAAETPPMAEFLPSAVFSAAAAAPGTATTYRADKRLFSLVSMEETAGGRRYIIQVAQDRSEDEHFRRTFGVLLLGTILAGTCAFAAISVTVTRRGLRPLREMTLLVSRVGPTQLAERISHRGWPNEIQPLATAFDDVLTRLEDAFTRLSQFSADLAHELRTPVANMLGEAQVALTRPRPAEEYRQIIESSVTECERLSGIIDNLLFLARAEAADGHVQRMLFDGKSAVAKMVGLYEPIADERHITIKCGGGGDIYADPVLFERAVNNLLENSLHYTPAGGMIAVSINSNHGKAEVSVTDTGCGIAPEHLPHVFDRFYRVDQSRGSEGTGLGLALVKSIMDLHSGNVLAESAPGRGTTVTLRFPAQEINEGQSYQGNSAPG